MRASRLFVKTHGCQMNEYDSARMVDVLRASHGYEIAGSEAEADLILLNTCSIRDKAQAKVFDQLGRWRALKERKPGLLIGVGGCVASQEGVALAKRAPFVDIVFGPQTLHRLPRMVEEAKTRISGAVVDISFPEIEKFDRLPPPGAEGPSAYVSVMEGCSRYCTFCVVPYTRGEEVSRPVDDVLREVDHLVAQGVREVNLLGQNVNAYRGPIDGDLADLAELIHYVAAIDGIERIRYTTSHPVEFTDNLIQAYAEVPALVDHLHLPVQSGSDRVLAAMKRGHTVLEYKSKIRKLRQVRPNISVSSDFIVGSRGKRKRISQRPWRLSNRLASIFLSPSSTVPAPVRQRRACRIRPRPPSKNTGWPSFRTAFGRKPKRLPRPWSAAANGYLSPARRSGMRGNCAGVRKTTAWSISPAATGASSVSSRRC